MATISTSKVKESSKSEHQNVVINHAFGGEIWRELVTVNIGLTTTKSWRWFAKSPNAVGIIGKIRGGFNIKGGPGLRGKQKAIDALIALMN